MQMAQHVDVSRFTWAQCNPADRCATAARGRLTTDSRPLPLPPIGRWQVPAKGHLLTTAGAVLTGGGRADRR